MAKVNGHIEKRGSTSFRAEIRTGTLLPNGQYEKIRSRVFRTRGEAEAELVRMQHERNIGSFVKPQTITVEAFLKDWLAGTIKKPRTIEWYTNIIENHLIPHLGALRLQDLTADHLRKYYAESVKKRKLSSTTVNGHHRAIRQALDWAVTDGKVAYNVADRVKPPRITNPPFQVIAPEDVPKFLEAASQNRFFALFVIALDTGARESELLGLKWSHVDLKSGIVQFLEQLHDPTMKTDASYRAVKLGGHALAVLKRHHALQSAEKLQLGPGYTNLDLVFTIPGGKPISRNNMERREFKSVLKAAELPDMRFQDLRHTTATLLLSNNVDPKSIANRLGHRDETMVLRRYGHVLPRMQEHAATVIDEMMGAVTSTFTAYQIPARRSRAKA